jgi:type II secretory pathway component PulJ
VEVMIGATLSAFVLVGVLAMNREILRSGIRITQYAEMEAQARRGIERFGRDVKNASDVRWASHTSLTLTVPTRALAGTPNPGSAQVTYGWHAETGTFFVVPGADASATNERVELVRGAPALANGDPGLTFVRFDRDGGPATTDLATKAVQVTMVLSRRTGPGAPAAGNVVSATFTMRNKSVLPP